MNLEPSQSNIDVEQTAGNVLEYGHAATRSRRWLRWLIILSVTAGCVTAAIAGVRSFSHWMAVRRGYAKVQTWLVAARTFTVPPGTLLYSENPADLAKSGVSYQSRQGGGVRSFTTFTAKYPLLRRVSYYAGGEPLLNDLMTIYVHEQRTWDYSGGTKPVIVSVSYFGPDQSGDPQFDCMSYDEKGTSKVPLPFMGGLSKAEHVDRPLAHLRIFAGIPNAADPYRFAIPFECDAGRGRFEFRMDDNVRDGGQLTPSVRVEWDGPSTRTVVDDRSDVSS